MYCPDYCMHNVICWVGEVSKLIILRTDDLRGDVITTKLVTNTCYICLLCTVPMKIPLANDHNDYLEMHVAIRICASALSMTADELSIYPSDQELPIQFLTSFDITGVIPQLSIM